MNDEKQLLIDFLNSSNRSQLLNLVVLTPFTTKELRVLNGFLAMNFPDFEAKESLLTNLIFKCTEIPRDEYSFTSIVTELDYFAKMFDLSVDWNGLAENPSADTLAGELVSSVLEIAVDQLKTEGLLTPLATDDQAPVIGNESLPLNFQDTTNSQVTNSQIQNESLPSQFQLGDSLPSDTGANISLEHDDLAEIPMENIELQMECVSNDEMHRNASNRELVSKELCVATGLSMESTEGAEFQTADEESVRVDISDESSHTANVVDDFQTRVEEVTDADEILIADRQIAVLENVSPEVEGVVVGIQAMVDTSTVVVENLISVEGVTTNDTVDIAPVAEENTTLEQKFGTFSSPSSPPIQVTLNLKETVDVVSDSQDVDKDPEELAMEIDNDREIFYDVADQPADITSAIIRNTTPTPAEPRPENFLMESEEKIDLVLDSQRVGEVAEDSLMEFDDSQIHFSSPAPKHTGLGTPTKSLIVNISEPPTTTSVRFQDSVGVIENNMFDDNSESDDDMKSAAEFDGNYAASQSLYYDSQPSVNTPTGITAPNPTPAAFRSGTKADNFEHEQLKPLDECWSTLRTQLYQSIRNADADTRVHRLSVENQEKHLLVARLEQELESKTESISNLAETFSENRSELQQMRNQVQVDLEIAQVDATTTLVALKEEVASKLQEIQAQYHSQLHAMNIQKSNELQALTAEKMELLPLKNRVTELVSSIEILQNANAELNQRIALATQDTLKCMEVDHKNIEVEKSDLEASFGSQLSQKQNDIDRLNSQVLALQSTISQLEDQLSKRSIIPANDETSQLQLKVQYYEKKIADLLSTIEFAQQEQDGTSDALKEVSEQKIAAEESLKELKSGFDELQEKHAEVLKLLEIATANSESRIEEVRAQFLTQLKQSSSQIEQLQIKYEREKQELESEKLQLNASNSALRLELAKKIEELEALESGRCDGTKKVNDLIADVERLTEDCRSKSIGLDGALAEIATLARRNESNVAKIQELEYFLREKTDTATKALFACKELEQKLDALEEAKAEMKAKLNQLAAETKLDTDSQIDQLKKEYDTLRLKVVQLENESSELEELKNSSTTRISLLEEEKAALARQKDEINVQNSHFVKENAALKQNIQKLMEDMVKAKESAMTKPSKPAETAAVALPPATSRPTKKRPLANTTMLSIPEDKDSPMRFQSAVGAPEPKKSKPSPKQKDDDDVQIIETAKPAPVKKKKRRESTSLDQIQQLRDENSAPDTNADKESTPVKGSLVPISTPESTSSIRRSRSSTTTMFIGISGFKDNLPGFNYKVRDEIIKAIKKLPNAKFLTGNEGKDHYDHRMTHIITPPDTKTLKALGAILSGAWAIQDPEWIHRSSREGKWVGEEEYGFRLDHSPFYKTSIYMAPNFAGLTSRGKKQNSMWPEFLKLLWVDCSKGVILESPKGADYVIKFEGDDEDYGRVTVIDWHSFMDLIPSKRLV